jgi:hypothetical protein
LEEDPPLFVVLAKVLESKRATSECHIVRMEEKTNAYKVLIGNWKGKRPLEGIRRGWKVCVKVDLKEI